MSAMKQENAALQALEQIKYNSHGSAAIFPVCMKVVSEYLEEDREAVEESVNVLGRCMEGVYA